MLAEGFLRVLLYREERKLASASKRSQNHSKDACNFSTTAASEAGRKPCKNAAECLVFHLEHSLLAMTTSKLLVI